MPVLSDPQREQFAHYVAQGDRTPVAYRKAGYTGKDPSKMGWQVKNQADVLARIKELHDELGEYTNRKIRVDKFTVISLLYLNALRSLQAVPVLDRQGNPTGNYRYDGSVANRALELIGKHLGMFTDRIEHTGPGGTPLQVSVTAADVSGLSVEELKVIRDLGQRVIAARQSNNAQGSIAQSNNAQSNNAQSNINKDNQHTGNLHVGTLPPGTEPESNIIDARAIEITPEAEALLQSEGWDNSLNQDDSMGEG